MNKYNSMGKKLIRISYRLKNCLLMRKILLNRKKVNPCQNPNQSNLSQLNHLQNYHKYCHHPAKCLITPKNCINS